MTCCCTVTVICVSPGRTPQPLSTAGSTCEAEPELPKLRLLPVTAAHSPLRSGFSRLQSTTRSPLPPAATDAFHWRFKTLRTIVAPGLVDVYGESFAAYARYLPQFALRAVLPLPNTSYA